MIGIIFLIIAVLLAVMLLFFKPIKGGNSSNGNGKGDANNSLVNRTTFAMAFTLLYCVLDYLISGPVWLVAYFFGYGSGDSGMNTAYFIIFAIMTFLIRLMVPRAWFS